MMKFTGSQAEERQIAGNILTDGLFSIPYRRIPACFEQFSRLFAENGIEPGGGFIVEAENTLPAALTLLYLLENACSVLPVPGGGLNGEGLPVFCRYALIARTLDKDDPEALNPARFLRIRKNPDWEAGGSIHSPPKLMMRTSGSTGTPKMAVHTHACLHGNALNCVHRFGLCHADRVAIPAPIYHMYGLGAAFLPGVMSGATMDIQKSANLLKFIQRESAFDPNVAFMTPSFCNTLLKARKSKRPYRLSVTAGDRFRADSFERYEAAFGPLVQLYGSTELGAIAAADPDLPLEVRRRTTGLPMPDVEFRLQAQAGEEGELWCKRTYGFEGYVNLRGDPVVLAAADYADGWFRTKDIAKLDPQGYLEILGRSDHSVNRDGLLLFFAELEKTIETMEQVEAVAVVAGGETERGKELIACCVVAKDSGLSAEAVRAHCFDKLPRRAVPDEVRILDSLPHLPNGKVDRLKLTTILASATLSI
ncbi:MAG: long-chain fatty acid--CoA ligase [Gammaproteobacteria bacterium]|nr:long-chain fatty acid--CoA ligase [Gammaproteobacteria bacterium]